jgi:hypothetical protein
MSYNEILDYIEREDNSEDGPLWQFRRLLAHQHTSLGHPDRNMINSRNWSRISVDNLAASLLPGLWVSPMFSPCSDLLE